jgi:tetratricopeptide (TPR) repeat protein
MFSTGGKRPFDAIARAEQAWQAGDSARAESLFEAGIAAYEREEPDGLAFALGRCGAFLLAQGRKDEAARVLERAIERKTDIPAIRSDYLRIIADRKDIDSFKRAVERMEASTGYQVQSRLLLPYAQLPLPDDKDNFAEQVARWIIERAEHQGDKEGRWAATGVLGRILERAGHLVQATKLWRTAFDEGSCDPDTISRLSMHLERAKDYAGAIQVIRAALTQRLPAGVEESLRKRLARCEGKTTDQGPAKTRKRPDVAAYSVRRESALFAPMFQVRLKTSVNDFGIVDNVARCLLASKESSTLVDIELTSGSEIRRVETLPLMGNIWFTPDGRGIGIRRTAAVGGGPTLLRFLDAEGRVAAESSVPDATSDVTLGPDLWYVGCRDGFLYAFDLDGRHRWAWETPGASNYTDNPYFRPCPYYLASQQSFAAVASMGDIYAIAPNGKTLWHAQLPSERETTWKFTIPFEGVQGSQEPYRVLELPPNSPPENVKSAYRRLALATHPDRNPDDSDATAKFRRIQEAYERILAGHSESGPNPAGITVSFGIQGIRPTASFVGANTTGVIVGSSEGRLYIFERNGTLREARVLGDGPVRVAVRPNGTVGAAWCSGALLFFRDSKIINAAESVDGPRALTMLGDDLVLWRRNEVQVMNAYGRLLWSLEFSMNITNVVAHADQLLCAAGVLTAFRRRPGE